MRKHRGNLLHKSAAVLLSAVLVVGTASGAASAHVLAREDGGAQGTVSGNDPQDAGSQPSRDAANAGDPRADEPHIHDGNTYAAWTETDRLPDVAGDYYLTEDVTLSDKWTVPSGGTTNLCLNGRTIRETGRTSVIQIDSNNDCLTLYDCTGGGTITGGQNSGVYNSGVFIMYGGEITGNYTDAAGGGGVFNLGSFRMFGGAIRGNRTEGDGGGVLTALMEPSAGVLIGGNAVITGNEKVGAGADNLYLYGGVTIAVEDSYPLTDGALIGVTTRQEPTAGHPVDITNGGSKDYSQYFRSDNPLYTIEDGAGHVVRLTADHSHVFDRENVSEDALKSPATCTQAAVYYKSCQCGEVGIGEDTFLFGSPLGHDYNKEIQDEAHLKVPAVNCQEYNTYWYECQRCGANAKDDAGESDKWFIGSVVGSHSYDESKWGYKVAEGHAHLCRQCNAYDFMTPHTPGAPATATSPQTCTVCGYIIAPAIGHSCSLQPVAKTEPSCTAPGKEAYYHCQDCGKDYEDAAGTKVITNLGAWGNIAPLRHHYGSEWKFDGNSHWYECSQCGDIKKDGIHSEDSGVITKRPTETEGGTITFSCVFCHKVLREENIALLQPGHTHNYSSGWNTDGSSHWHECNLCGDRTGVGGHRENGGTVIIQATGTSTGVKTYYCTQCGYEIRSELIPAVGSGNLPGGETGKVDMEVQTDGRAPFIQISTPTEKLADILLTDSEKQQAANGAPVQIIFGVKDSSDSVGSGDKALVEEALKGDTPVKGFTVGQYFDITLSKVVGGSSSTLTESGEGITITVTIPEDLKNTGSGIIRDFEVIRVNNGVAEVLKDLDSSNDTITITTDRFSTFVIVYKDKDGSGGSDGDGSGGNDGDGSGGSDGDGSGGSDGNGGSDGDGNGGNDGDGNGGSDGDGSGGNDGDGNGGSDGDGSGGSGGDGNGGSDGDGSGGSDGDGNGGSGGNGTGGSSNRTGQTTGSEPRTGEGTSLYLYATLAMVAGFAYLLLYFTEHRGGMTEEKKEVLVSALVAWAKKGGKIRRLAAIAVIFFLLAYYHSIGKKMSVAVHTSVAPR